jgi:cyclopropane fatty-acyl-phospholipid synthase-like methyltransferase
MFRFLNKFLGQEVSAPPEPKKQAPTLTVKVASPPQAAVAELNISRTDLLQHMWGRGLSGPGDPAYFVGLVSAFQLGPQKNVLDLSAGLGGLARDIAGRYKTYVTGFERDAQLANEGMHLSSLEGNARNAAVKHYQPEEFEFNRPVDAVIMRELLYSICDKDAFVVKVSGALRSHGHLLMTDFICDDPAVLESAAVKAWQQVERDVHIVLPKEMARVLTSYGFDLRTSEDTTRIYMRQILAGLGLLAKNFEGQRLSAAAKQLVAAEVDFWTRRLAALEAGVKHMRFHAVKCG